MKRFIKELIPPIVYSFRDLLLKDKTFKSYDEALNYCQSNGYENLELVDVVYKKTLNYLGEIKTVGAVQLDPININLITVLLYISKQKGGKEIIVIDFGGACGVHYFIAKKFLGNEFKLKWIVVESGEMVKKAKLFQGDELFFYDDLDQAIEDIPTIDLIHSSGTIQYLKEPYQMLQKLLLLESAYILINRLSICTTKDLITIQKSRLSENGVGKLPVGFVDKDVFYPHYNVLEKKLFEIINIDYDIIFKYNDGSGVHKVTPYNIKGLGIFAGKRNNNVNITV